MVEIEFSHGARAGCGPDISPRTLLGLVLSHDYAAQEVDVEASSPLQRTVFSLLFSQARQARQTSFALRLVSLAYSFFSEG